MLPVCLSSVITVAWPERTSGTRMKLINRFSPLSAMALVLDGGLDKHQRDVVCYTSGASGSLEWDIRPIIKDLRVVEQDGAAYSADPDN